jgi:hypothetical protein
MEYERIVVTDEFDVQPSQDISDPVILGEWNINQNAQVDKFAWMPQMDLNALIRRDAGVGQIFVEWAEYIAPNWSQLGTGLNGNGSSFEFQSDYISGGTFPNDFNASKIGVIAYNSDGATQGSVKELNAAILWLPPQNFRITRL